MAAHSIASLTISFGLVSIPVKMYSATQSSGGIRFNLIHENCGSRLRQQYVCIKEDVVVPRDEMVKGYEFATDQYVVFTKEELKALEEAGTGAAEICEFLPLAAIDPVFYDRAYYLGPDKGGAKPYTLLRDALERSGKGALGRYAARGKQYLVLIRPMAGGLAMQQLLYAEDVRSIDELNIPTSKVSDAELKLALQLIEQLTSDEFHPENYKDEVRQRIEEAVQRKVEGQEVTITEKPVEGGGQIIDLMEALRASLQRREAPDAQPEPAARKPARRAQSTGTRAAKGAKAARK
ncbi:MAG TPA: Ku protein [Burkholderiaceae bacterium]|nr:Ku protein [Burkholderiaceae bacterium]